MLGFEAAAALETRQQPRASSTRDDAPSSALQRLENAVLSARVSVGDVGFSSQDVAEMQASSRLLKRRVDITPADAKAWQLLVRYEYWLWRHVHLDADDKLQELHASAKAALAVRGCNTPTVWLIAANIYIAYAAACLWARVLGMVPPPHVLFCLCGTQHESWPHRGARAGTVPMKAHWKRFSTL